MSSSPLGSRWERDAGGEQAELTWAESETLHEPPDPKLLAGELAGELEGELAEFRLLRQLGRGGMGVVYAAWDTVLERRVALKLLHPWASPRDVERFRAEGKAAARLEHEGIVGVHRLGAADGRPFMVLDLVRGESLKQRVRREGAFDQDEAALLVEQLARAISHAHHHGILHRDLKPQNVLLDAHGRPRITDFGLARDLRDVSARITLVGEVLGTPAYMAPEQASGCEVDARADVYALGAILYETLTGDPPFKGPALRVLEQVITQSPAPPSSLRADVCPRLERICLRCLSKAPEHRYASALDLAAALVGWRLRGRAPIRPAAGPTRVPRPGSRREAAFALALVGGFILAAWLLGGLLGSEARRPPGAIDDVALAGGDGLPTQLASASSRREGSRARESRSAQAETQRRKALHPRKDRDPQTLTPPQDDADGDPAQPADSAEPSTPGDTPARGRRLASTVGKGRTKFASATQAGGGATTPASFQLVRPFGEEAESDSEDVSGDEDAPELSAAELDPNVSEFEPPSGAVPSPAAIFEPEPEPAPSPVETGPVGTFPELLVPARSAFYTWGPYLQLNEDVGGFVGQIGVTPTGELLVAHSPRGVDRVGWQGLVPEVTLTTRISSAARLAGGTFFSTSDPSRPGAGDLWLRDDTGRWSLSLDGPGRELVTAQVNGQLYAVSGDQRQSPVEVALLVRQLGWRHAVTLDLDGIPTAAVGHDGWLYVGIFDDDGDAELYRIQGGVFEELDEASGPDADPGDRKEITAMLSVRGHLFVASGIFDVDGLPLEGAVEVLVEDDRGRLRLEKLDDLSGDAPRALAYQDGTIYVGTARGDLLYLTGELDNDGDFDADWVVEPGTLPNAGIHSLTVIDRDTLLLGVAGPLGAEVYRRVASR